LKELT
jgi:hypothetical protein